MIIGICGFIGCGKDTVADYLINEHGYSRESFAGNLKDAVSVIFGWDREMLEGRSKAAREQREQVDPWWAEKLNMPTLTPRWVLQYWGTEVARKSFHNDIWIHSLERKLQNKTDVVITDCRFPNEVKSITRNKGLIIWVQRGDLPVWYEIGKDAASGHKEAIAEINHLGVHASEWSWLNTEFDATIQNNRSLSDLYDNIERFLKVSD